MKTIAFAARAVVLMLGLRLAAGAQQPVPPPPKPAGNGPGLDVTMQFIQERIGEQGKINFASYFHNNADNSDGQNRWSYEESNVVANAAACRVSYHWRVTRDDTVLHDDDLSFPLHDVRDLVIRTGDQQRKLEDANGGQSTIESRVDPPVFWLAVRLPGKRENRLIFSDEDTANRVAKAITHAVELCGGGDKGPF